MPDDLTILAESDLPDSCFAYVPDEAKGADGSKSDRKLRLCNMSGELDSGIIGAAKAALGKGFRGNKVQLPAGARSGAIRKVNAAAAKLGLDPFKASEVVLTQDDLWFAETTPTGFVVALWIEPETAAKLAITGGESADDLHITLAYCGDAEDMGDLMHARAITAVERDIRWRSPIAGKVAGYGRFIASDTSDGQDVFYAAVDVPGLAEVRQCVVQSLMEAGCMVSAEHGFTPHITLAYIDHDAKNPVDELPPLELSFDAVTVSVGPKRIPVPFSPQMMAYGEHVSMSEESADVPLTTPLGVMSARPLFFSFDQEWIPYLPKPGQYHHSQWGKLDLTPDFYNRIIGNFRDVYKQDLPISLEHDRAITGAVGWIKPGCMRLATDGSIEVKPTWNERGQAMLDGDRFRYVSAEFAFNWQDPVSGDWHKDVPVGHTLCTRPHFKTDVLQPLAASEGAALIMAQSHQMAGIPGKETNMADEPTPSTTATAAPAVVTPPAQVSLMDVVITAEQRSQERQQFADLTARVELAERRATAAEARLLERERSLRKERFLAEVMGRSSENGDKWLCHHGIEHEVATLTEMADKLGDDSPILANYIEQKRNEIRAVRATGVFDPISVSARGAQGDVMSQAEHLAGQKRQANPALSQEAAMAAVFKENPEMYVRLLQAK